MNLELAILKELHEAGPRPITAKLALGLVRLALPKAPTDDEFEAAKRELVKAEEIDLIPNKDTGEKLLITDLGTARLMSAGLLRL